MHYFKRQPVILHTKLSRQMVWQGNPADPILKFG